MEKLKTYICVICTCLSFLYAIFVTVRMIVKKKKAGATPDIVEVIDSVMSNMQKAEELYNNFTAYGTKFSANKLEDVLTKVQNFCLTRGITYDEDTVRNIVEKLIKFSKTVNAKK